MVVLTEQKCQRLGDNPRVYDVVYGRVFEAVRASYIDRRGEVIFDNYYLLMPSRRVATFVFDDALKFNADMGREAGSECR